MASGDTPVDMSVMFMPVGIPVQNKSMGIVTRPDAVSIHTSSTHLWAGPLQDQITATLAENIRIQGLVGSVQVYPGSRYARPELLIELEILRFDGKLDEDFTCAATWTISDNRQKNHLDTLQFSITVPVNSGDYSAYVRAASTAISRLSEEIGLSLQKIRRLP